MKTGEKWTRFFDAPSRSEYSAFKKCNKEITVGRINLTKVQKLVCDTFLSGYDIYPNQLSYWLKDSHHSHKLQYSGLSWFKLAVISLRPKSEQSQFSPNKINT